MVDLESLPSQASKDSLPGSMETLPPDDEDDDGWLQLAAGVRIETDEDDEGPVVDAREFSTPCVSQCKEELPASHFCCGQDCAKFVAIQHPQKLQEWQKLKAKLSNDETNEFIYRLLVVMQAPNHGHKKFQFLGEQVCREGFVNLVGIGNSRMTRLLEWRKQGHVHPPRDLRHTTVKERGVATSACDKMLQYAYDVLAQTVNSSDARPTDSLVDAVVPELVENDSGDGLGARAEGHIGSNGR